MGNGDIGSTQNYKLWSAGIIAVMLAILILSLPYFVSLYNNLSFPTPTDTPTFAPISTPTAIPTNTSTDTPTSTPTDMSTPTNTPTSTPTNTPTSTFDLSTTPTPFPSPVKNSAATNLPNTFSVGPWHDDYVECDGNPNHFTVRIYGVEISHGTSPYEFTFWQFDNVYHPFIKSVTPFKSSKELVEFEEPVVVNWGAYVHVVLTFHLADNTEVTWIDDLYYPFPENISHCTSTIKSSTTPTLDLSTTATVKASVTFTQTGTPIPTTQIVTTNATETLRAAFNEVDKQFQESVKSNIAYNAPETMKLDETITIELLLNPSLSQKELATQLVERSDLLTSTAEPGQLFTEQGGNVDVVTSEIVITDRMKAVLKSRKPGAFEIHELHDNAEQPISGVDTTKWRWSVTAKDQGEQTLELVLYRLIKYDDNEYWREVETYKADINVEVTASQWLKSLDWKWILGILATALLIPLFFRWFDSHKKKADEQKDSNHSKKKHRKN